MKRVLYAEDSIASQALMRRYLKDLCEVVIAPTPRAATSLLERESFSALITDFMFQDNDATDLIRKTRESRSAAELPIVVVSSAMDPGLASKLLTVGANETAAKPLHPTSFRTLIERMLETPYVNKVESRTVSVPCLRWRMDGLFHEFCPELGIRVCKPTAEEAAEAMQTELKEKFASGSAFGDAAEIRLHTHAVEA